MLVGPLQNGWFHARPRGWACHPYVAADPHRAAPGAVPFADHLRATNETDHADHRDEFAGEHRRSERAREPTTPSPAAAAARGWATLGEVLPVEPHAETRVHEDHVTRVMSPLGAMIDLTA
ncbi:MAG: hypothetical protein R3B49_07940 [Phycisphaerales bacterium]